MKPKCIAIDFDYTLAHFINGYNGLFEIFTKQGIPFSLVKQTYEEVKQTGFSLSNFIQILEEKTDIILNLENIYTDFQTWLLETLCLYEDAKFLQKPLNIPVVIITFGDSEFQLQKIHNMNIVCNSVHTVSCINSKSDTLNNLLQTYGAPILYIDDKASELDAIADSGIRAEDVITFHIFRKDSPYKFEKSKIPHKQINSLHQIFELVDNSDLPNK